MSARLDELAEALGRARIAHEKLPNDLLRQLRYEEARADYLDAQLKLVEEDRRKAIAEARRALADVVRLSAEMAALKAGISGRIRAMIDRRAEAAKANRRRAPAGSRPLLEGVN